MKRILSLLLAVAAVSVACTSAGGGGSSSSSSATPTVSPTGSKPTDLGGGGGEDSSPPSSPTTTPTTPRRTTPPATGPVRELAGPCPYITAEAAREAEGDRVGNVFRLSSTPIGCRFYFENDETRIVLQITFARYADNNAALASLRALALRTPGFVRDTDIGDGAISVKADLQGTQTWACNFAKGPYVVTVHTRQPDPSYNARRIARLIEPKVP